VQLIIFCGDVFGRYGCPFAPPAAKTIVLLPLNRVNYLDEKQLNFLRLAVIMTAKKQNAIPVSAFA
jgi:hypothetical protein